MIQAIHIEGYRGFDQFDMAGLGRINLLVGTNNSGKTSVLEALYLLTSGGDPAALWQVLWRRGERVTEPRAQGYDNPEADLCHLFRGHFIEPGASFSLSARNQTPERKVTFTIGTRDGDDGERERLFDTDPPPASLGSAAELRFRRLSLRIGASSSKETTVLQLTPRGGLRSDSVEVRRISRRRYEVQGGAQYIQTESLTGDELVQLWDRVALSDDEPLVLQALQFVDPDIERIAAQASQARYGSISRGGFIVKLRGLEHPIPIGSLGDGMWRMLALAITLTQSKGGVLLVDEIDTGLHYSVMAEMWRLIEQASRLFGVQVFATTHSSDCVHALGAICRLDASGQGDVSIQRIERNRNTAVPFTELEVRRAAERQIEVR